MKILVIEDDLFLLRSLELMLKKHGYDVITASLGNEAIKNIINAANNDALFPYDTIAIKPKITIKRL